MSETSSIFTKLLFGLEKPLQYRGGSAEASRARWVAHFLERGMGKDGGANVVPVQEPNGAWHVEIRVWEKAQREGRHSSLLGIPVHTVCPGDSVRANPDPIPSDATTIAWLQQQADRLFPGDGLANVRARIYRSFVVPQWGEYHNEGALMATHLVLILSTIDKVVDGVFDEAVPHGCRQMLMRAAERDPMAVRRYVFLHDIAKPDTMTVKLPDGSEKALPWQAWLDELGRLGEMSALDGNEDAVLRALQQLGISRVSYYQGDHKHGHEGAEWLETAIPGLDESILFAVDHHEAAYQFSAINADSYRRTFGSATPEQRDFVMLAAYVDTMASLRRDGKPDLSNFLALYRSREKSEALEVLEARLATGGKLDKQKAQRALADMKRSTDPLSMSDVAAAEARVRDLAKIGGYDVAKLSVSTAQLVAAGTLTEAERDRLLELAENDPAGIGRAFGPKMKVLSGALAAAKG